MREGSWSLYLLVKCGMFLFDIKITPYQFHFNYFSLLKILFLNFKKTVSDMMSRV